MLFTSHYAGLSWRVVITEYENLFGDPTKHNHSQYMIPPSDMVLGLKALLYVAERIVHREAMLSAMDDSERDKILAIIVNLNAAIGGSIALFWTFQLKGVSLIALT